MTSFKGPQNRPLFQETTRLDKMASKFVLLFALQIAVILAAVVPEQDAEGNKYSTKINDK